MELQMCIYNFMNICAIEKIKLLMKSPVYAL